MDAYTYLFWAPEMSAEEVATLNPELEFNHLGDDIWLGKYDLRIKTTDLFLQCYYIAVTCWGLILIISSYLIWKEKIRPWWRRRKGKSA